MDPSVPRVRLELWRADAIVLFDWLMSVDLNAVPINHRAEKQALADLLTRLEHETDIPGVTHEEIDAARGGRRSRHGLVTAPGAARIAA